MKFTKYFMPFAALALLASCSNDKLDGPANGPEENSDDALYLSLAISTLGTRTQTGDQAAEVGKDYENNISNAYLFFVDGSTDVVIASAQLNPASFTVANNGTTYYVRGSVTRKHLIDAVDATGPDGQDGTTLSGKLLVVANLPAAIVDTDVEDLYQGQDVKTLTLKLSTESDLSAEEYPATFWTEHNFLMSNSADKTFSITKDDVSGNKHHDISDPLDLGKVTVQRAMSRYDLNIPALDETSKGIKFAFKADGTPLKYTDTEYATAPIKLDFVEIAPFNMGNEFYLFKQASEDTPSGTNYYTDWAWQLFRAETTANYVKDPQVDAKKNLNNVEGVLFRDLNSFYSSSSPDAYTYFTFTSIPSLSEEDNNVEGGGTGLAQSINEKKYYKYTYVAPASLMDAENQLYGNAPGVVFKAEILLDGTNYGAENGNVIYAFDNKIYGSFEKLLAVVNTPYNNLAREEQEMLAYFNKAKASVSSLAEVPNANLTTDNEASLKDALRANLFQVYTPTNIAQSGAPANYKYYCYYYYWNRHNDNDMSWQMGPMEFATVRNNIYKLNVNSVSLLGYPGDVPPPPTTKIEEDKLYMSVEVEVVKWEVRENNIDF